MTLRIVPPPSIKARAACEVLAPQGDNSDKAIQIGEEAVPQIVWLQSELSAGKELGENAEDSAARPLVFLPISDNPNRDKLFFTALRAALWPDSFTSLPTIDLSAVAEPAKPFFALRILADYNPVFFPARTEHLSPSWALRQAQRLRRLPSQVSFILSTSGSTKPGGRLVGISLEALQASHRATAQRLGGNGIWVSALPRDHIAGFQVIARAYAGGTEPLTIDMTGGFKLSRLREALQNTPSDNVPIYLSLVPTQLRRALADPKTTAALQICSAILVGGAHISSSLLSAGREAGLNLVTTYGMTETCGGCVYDGVPLPRVTVAVKEGRIWLATPTLMSGYLEAESDPEIREFSGTTWLATNDTGKIVFADENEGIKAEKNELWDTAVIIDMYSPAHLKVLGRLDDTIISGGENISLPLVTRAAEQVGFPGLEFCALKDEEWGQILCAVFSSVGLPTAEPTTAPNLAQLGYELRESLREHLPSSHLPRAAALLPHFPELPSGKLDRRALEEAVRVLDKQNRTWRK
ncbi:MAG: AMP-binding protein [Varibaculum cambriense]|uniref:AMP-binding protein n=1 Tax=Varibaculum cambriense TaxID=184870 RepID=UPI00241D656F|nr:AMP-binding protein [Varibaculum cambriense]MBS6753764.1 AMP-binding protein [Varibaculum cambriense]